MARKLTHDQIELLETGKIAKSLKRLSSLPRNYGSDGPARRALYHAICMIGFLSTEQQASIRITMKLP